MKSIGQSNLVPGKGNRGGKREGAGRKLDAFKERCRNVVDKPSFWKWAEDVFDGKDVNTKLDKEGCKIKLPADVSERVYLWEKLAAYAYDKPAQAMQVTGKDGEPIVIQQIRYAESPRSV